MLKDRFSEIDYEQAKLDVEPFVKNARALDVWSKEFFSAITESLCEK